MHVNHSKRPEERKMEDEELERGKGELLLYLLRLALFLSVAVLLLQLVFLGWLVISPESIPAFAGVIYPLGGEASMDARLVNVAQDVIVCMGLSLSLLFFCRAAASAASAAQSAESDPAQLDALRDEERNCLRSAGWVLLVAEPFAVGIKALLALLLGVGGVSLQLSGVGVLAALILLWSSRRDR